MNLAYIDTGEKDRKGLGREVGSSGTFGKLLILVKKTEKVLEGRQTAVVGLVQQLTNDPKFEDLNPASIDTEYKWP